MFLVFWFSAILVAPIVTARKGYSFVWGLLAGILLGWLGVLICCFLTDRHLAADRDEERALRHAQMMLLNKQLANASQEPMTIHHAPRRTRQPVPPPGPKPPPQARLVDLTDDEFNAALFGKE